MSEKFHKSKKRHATNAPSNFDNVIKAVLAEQSNCDDCFNLNSVATKARVISYFCN